MDVTQIQLGLQILLVYLSNVGLMTHLNLLLRCEWHHLTDWLWLHVLLVDQLVGKGRLLVLFLLDCPHLLNECFVFI